MTEQFHISVNVFIIGTISLLLNCHFLHAELYSLTNNIINSYVAFVQIIVSWLSNLLFVERSFLIKY